MTTQNIIVTVAVFVLLGVGCGKIESVSEKKKIEPEVTQEQTAKSTQEQLEQKEDFKKEREVIKRVFLDLTVTEREPVVRAKIGYQVRVIHPKGTSTLCSVLVPDESVLLIDASETELAITKKGVYRVVCADEIFGPSTPSGEEKIGKIIVE